MYSRKNIASYAVPLGDSYGIVSPKKLEEGGSAFVKPFMYYTFIRGIFDNPVMLGKSKGSYYV